MVKQLKRTVCNFPIQAVLLMLTLLALLAPQIIYPMIGLSVLSASAQAQKVPLRNRVIPHAPAMAPGKMKSSAKLYKPLPNTSPLALNFKTVPSAAAITVAGQDCGPLVPNSTADLKDYAAQLIQDGAPAEQRNRLLANLEKTNYSFAKAINEWNKKNFKEAVSQFQQHLKDYPQSPWKAEVMMHIADEESFTNRYDEAMQLYQQVLSGTIYQQPTATNNARLFKQQQNSYELHQKAMQKLAAAQVMVGQFDSAKTNVEDILRNDPDWRRRTWASYWLQKLHTFQANLRELHTCGGNAMGIVLASFGKAKAARDVSNMRPPRDAGFSLAELSQIAGKAGAPMQGFHLPANQPSTFHQLANLQTPFLIHINNVKSMPASAMMCDMPGMSGMQPSTEHRTEGHGHFFVVLKVDAAKKQIDVINPRDNSRSSFTFADLAQEWSGYGLAAAKAHPVKVLLTQQQTASSTRLSWLDNAAMKKVVGGCYVLGKQDDLGSNPNNRTVRRACSPRGEPTVSINQVTANMFVQDTPIGYDTPIGPDVNITLSYNSQDATSVNNAFGNKWIFNYGSYLSVLPSGAATLIMPDGSEDHYTPNGNGTYFGELGNYSTLVKTGDYSYELRFQYGGKMVYGIPSGISSQRPVLLQVQDRWGQSISMGYVLENGNVDLTTVTDAQGKETYLTYDVNGHITQVIDPFEHVASFDYDSNGNMVQCTDVEGNAFQYTYDNDVRITQINTAQGPWQFVHEDYDYNSADDTYYTHVVHVTDPAGATEMYGYETHSRYVPDHVQSYFHTDQLGNITLSEVNAVIDGKGKITKVLFPNGDSVSYTYDYSNGLPLTVTDARGKLTRFTYNGQGQMASMVNPRGYSTYVYFAANGLDASRWMDTSGNSQDITDYNTYHQPTHIEDGEGADTYFTYTAWGAIDTVTNDLGQISVYHYDATTKQLTSIGRKADSSATEITLGSFTYDDVGRVYTATDASNKTVTYHYNNLGAVTRTDYPDGTFSSVLYVCCGMPGVVVGRDGKKSYYDYDALKRLTRVQDAAGNSVEYHYDAAGDMTSMIDAMGSQTKWKYDALGRVIKKIYADGTSNNYGYTQGLLTQSQNARGAVTQYLYDDNANLTTVDYQNSPDVTFQYDSLDRMTRMYDAAGERRFEYDQVSRVTRVSNPWNNDDVFYDYDGLGRRIRMNLNDRVENSRPKMRYTYDSLGRLSSLIHEQFASTSTWTYHYAGNSGMTTELDYPDNSKSTFAYDDMERLTQVQNLDPTGANISKYDYGFDDVSNPQRDVRTYVDKTIGTNPTQRVNYTYDTVNQLLNEVSNETPNPLLNKSYSYDPMGNRLTASSVTAASTSSTSYQPNRLNQITGTITSYTGGGDDTSSIRAYDADGNLTDVKTSTSSGVTGHTQYVYDDASRLTDVITHDPATDANVHKSTFTIDGFSRVAMSTEFNWNGTSWVKQSQKHYVYDGLNTYVELGDSTDDINKILLRGGNGEILVEPLEATWDFRYYYHDGSGNVSDVVDLSVATYTSLGHYDYDAYGNLTGSSGSDPDANYYRYSGKEYIPSVGMYNYGYRFYSPGMGRWINRDPIGESGGLNVYEFAGNNPINSGDAYGEYVVLDDGIVIVGGAVAGLAGQAVEDAIAGKVSPYESYAAAMVGGSVGAEATIYAGPIVGGAAGAAASNAYTQGLNNITAENKGFDGASFAADTALGAGMGALPIPDLKVPGITAGKGSYSAVAKRLTTQLNKRTIKNIAVKSGGKMVVSQIVKDGNRIVVESAIGAAKRPHHGPVLYGPYPYRPGGQC